MATPYELRFDMYNAALERQKDAYFSAVEQDRELQDRMGEAPTQRRFPTPKDVIEEANEIMAFVNGDNQ